MISILSTRYWKNAVEIFWWYSEELLFQKICFNEGFNHWLTKKTDLSHCISPWLKLSLSVGERWNEIVFYPNTSVLWLTKSNHSLFIKLSTKNTNFTVIFLARFLASTKWRKCFKQWIFFHSFKTCFVSQWCMNNGEKSNTPFNFCSRVWFWMNWITLFLKNEQFIWNFASTRRLLKVAKWNRKLFAMTHFWKEDR